MSSAGFITEVGEEDIRRERQKARELRKSQWWKRRRSNGVCHYCSNKVSPRELTMDHIVPIVRGGKSTKGNIVPACKACNNKKKHSLLMDWEEYVNRQS
jgi:5-methylcytosine-specific restriction endonuclease McrA